jgi:hypothetical protein
VFISVLEELAKENADDIKTAKINITKFPQIETQNIEIITTFL